MNENQEPKYKIQDGKIVNRASGEAIPDDEPIMIFRARDKHAHHAIAYYLGFLRNERHHAAVTERLNHFEDFAADNPERMHEPDTVK